jgi:hypothetical protein
VANSLWKLEPGWLCGYTEDRELIREIKRNRKKWAIMADYFRGNRLIGVQVKIPAKHRQAAERVFKVTVEK